MTVRNYFCVLLTLYVIFFYRRCEEIRGKNGEVKTTAEQLESGIPEKLSDTHTGEPFLRHVNIFQFSLFSTWLKYFDMLSFLLHKPPLKIYSIDWQIS